MFDYGRLHKPAGVNQKPAASMIYTYIFDGQQFQRIHSVWDNSHGDCSGPAFEEYTLLAEYQNYEVGSEIDPGVFEIDFFWSLGPMTMEEKQIFTISGDELYWGDKELLEGGSRPAEIDYDLQYTKN